MFSIEILSIETQLSMLFLQNDNKLTHNCQNLWRKKTIKNGGFQCFRRRSCHNENYRLLLICCHPSLYRKNSLRFWIIIYCFHVFQTSAILYWKNQIFCFFYAFICNYWAFTTFRLSRQKTNFFLAVSRQFSLVQLFSMFRRYSIG